LLDTKLHEVFVYTAVPDHVHSTKPDGTHVVPLPKSGGLSIKYIVYVSFALSLVISLLCSAYAGAVRLIPRCCRQEGSELDILLLRAESRMRAERVA
jgi:hypothetical protein